MNSKKTTILFEAYKKAIDEDAMFEDGEAAAPGAGDISSPDSAAGDTDVITNFQGTSRDEVLGKIDPKKGFMGPGDFNIPKNVLGKGKMLRRREIPSLKKKGQKNAYASGMQIISETQAKDLVKKICCNMNEDEIPSKIVQLRQQLKDPAKLDAFIDAHAEEIEKFNLENDLKPEDKGMFSRMWNAIKYASKKGFQFVKKHFWKILLIVLIIAGIIWFGQSEWGIRLGSHIFGEKYSVGVNNIKHIVSGAFSTVLPTTHQFETIIQGLKAAKSWNKAPDSLIPTGSYPSIAIDKGNTIFQAKLLDGRSAYQFVDSSDPTGWYIPEF